MSEGGQSPENDSVQNGQRDSSTRKDAEVTPEQRAVAVYEEIVDAAITGSHDRHIWLQLPALGHVDYPERNWRISVAKRSDIPEKARAESFPNAFSEHEFNNGIIIVKQGPILDTDGETLRGGATSRMWLARTEEGYRGVTVKRTDEGPIQMNIKPSEEIVDAVDRTARLMNIPARILDGFGSFEAFQQNLMNGLHGERPISGLVTPDAQGLHVFGGRNGQRLPEMVKLLEISRRKTH